MPRLKRPKARAITPALNGHVASLVKGMLARGDRQSDISAYFSMNAGRVSEIQVKFPNVVAAPASELPPPGPYAVVPIAELNAAKERLEKKRAAHKAWRERNPEHAKQYARAYYARNREKMIARAEDYRRSPDFAPRRAAYLSKTFAHRLFRSARNRAIARGEDFEITPEWIQCRLDLGVCEATGLHFDFERTTKGKFLCARAPSLDRKNPGLGYTPDNCWVVCLQVNLAKSEWGMEALLEVSRALSAAQLMQTLKD